MELLQDLTILLLGIHPKNRKQLSTAGSQQHSQQLNTGTTSGIKRRRDKQTQSLRSREYYLALRRKKTLQYRLLWRTLCLVKQGSHRRANIISYIYMRYPDSQHHTSRTQHGCTSGLSEGRNRKLFKEYRVLVLQDKKNYGAQLHYTVNIPNATEM